MFNKDIGSNVVFTMTDEVDTNSIFSRLENVSLEATNQTLSQWAASTGEDPAETKADLILLRETIHEILMDNNNKPEVADQLVSDFKKMYLAKIAEYQKTVSK